jgi:homoserine O-acetyltransferase/O-succinyltransferase
MKKLFLFLLFSQVIYAQKSKQLFFEMGDFQLENGQKINACKLGYRTFGKLNATKSNAILVPTWFSGTSEAKSFVATSGLADTSRFFVIIVDALGNGVSSSPSNSASQSNLNFPTFSIRDMVKSEYELATKVFDLKKLYAVMGISMGGMQTFQWVVSYPDFVEKAVPIIGTPKQSSYDKIFWNAQLNIIQRGNYAPETMKSVGALHEMNLWTPAYHEQNLKPDAYDAYIAKNETDYVKFQNVYNWSAQLKAMLGHDIFENNREEKIKLIKAKMLIVIANQDHMVNPASAIAMAKTMKIPILELEGDCGHMATSCESEKMNFYIKAFLE